MCIRPLTDVEISQIKEAKKVANLAIKEQRQALTKQIKDTFQSDKKLELQQKYKALKYITGKPVFILQGDRSILLNYELLLNLYRSIKRRNLPCEINIFSKPSKMLTLDYPIGSAALNKLPAYQTVLLQGLPVIKIEE